MTHQLEDIDTAAIEKLVEIKEERDRLKGFRKKAEEKKDSVDEAVYERVVSDYDVREAELEEEAEPLRVEAAGEYAKLLSIFEELESTADEARSAKEELEFRHDVGELDDDALAEKLEEPEETIASCEEQLEAAEELKERFLEAVDSEEELESAIAAAEEASDEPEEEAPEETEEEAPEGTEERSAEEAAPGLAGEGRAADELAAAGDADETFMAGMPGGKGPPGAGADRDTADRESAHTDETVFGVDDTLEEMEDEADEGGATTVLPTETGAAEPRPSETVVVAANAGAGADEAGQDSEPGTMVLPTARLVLTGNGESGREYPLGVINNIGRADGNQIQLQEPTVSRKHAVIEATPQGFSLRDLNSDNGTLVNDEPITECTLSDGDHVQFGAVELVFHTE